MTRIKLLGLLMVLLSGSIASPDSLADQQAGGEGATAQPPSLKVTIDTSEVPELATWAEEAKRLVEEWHPKIADLLKEDGFRVPAEVKLIFKKDMKGVAGTSRATIRIAADWVKRHPEDYGMVIHELTHVIQSYPRSDAGWLVEGIADHVRFYHYEPQTKLSLRNPKKASYRDGYRTTAQFLAWVERKYDKEIVGKLNRALRQSRYDASLFKTSTSRGLDELWTEFVADASVRDPKDRSAVTDKTPLRVTTRKAEDRVSAQIQGESAVLTVTSPSGIGAAAISRENEQWPEKMVVRLGLSGLERFHVSNGRYKVMASVSSSGGHHVLLALSEEGKKEIMLDRSSPYWTEVRVLEVQNEPAKDIPPRHGGFEVTLPRALLATNPGEITFEWIDFYR